MQTLKLSYEFYNRNTIEVAKNLLGKWLIRDTGEHQKIGKIVEVEAYPGAHDLASHTAKGLTKRTQVMFGPPAVSYVYLIYGIHHCLNVVTDKEGVGAAVLLRALEPIANINARTQGPGLLCKAMKIDKSLNAHSLLSDDLFIAYPEASETFEIVKKPRIGVGYAKEWANELLRFYIKDNDYISKP